MLFCADTCTLVFGVQTGHRYKRFHVYLFAVIQMIITFNCLHCCLTKQPKSVLRVQHSAMLVYQVLWRQRKSFLQRAYIMRRGLWPVTALAHFNKLMPTKC